MTWQGNDDAYVAILRGFKCGDLDASGTIAIDDAVWLSLIKTPSQLESMVHEARLLHGIVGEEPDVANWMRWYGLHDVE